MKIIPKKLENNVKQAREAKRLSHKGLADVVGISKEMVTSVERGRHRPSVVTLFLIAEALDVDVNDLYSLDAIKGCL